MPALKKSKARYSAAELFGHNFESLPPAELRRLSMQHAKELCPFRTQANGREMPCTKNGGVCSIRPYFQIGGSSTAEAGGTPTITCPNRFLEQREVFSWVGEVLLQTNSPIVVPELPFLMGDPDAESGDEDAVGKIDMVLVNKEANPISWCALEMQAVYFSGMSMENDRRLWRTWQSSELPYPPVMRRPDFRSSGPKRLMPQLQVKVPTITRWGKKMAVVVDTEFWGSMRGMRETSDLSNCDIAWFVVQLTNDPKDKNLKLVRDSLHYTTLANAVEGLTGGRPLPREKFEQLLLAKLARL